MRFALSGFLLFLQITVCSVPADAAGINIPPTYPGSSSAPVITALNDSSPAPQPRPRSAAQKHRIKVIRIAGVSMFKESELQNIMSDITGTDASYDELEKAAARITAHYAAHGYTVKTSMPKQDITEGVVLYYLLENRKENAARRSAKELAAAAPTRLGPFNPLSWKTSTGGFYLIKPTLTVYEEYNDNITESKDQRKSDMITSITPSVALKYGAKRWDWGLSYSPTYRNYLQGSMGDSLSHNLNISGNVRVLGNFLFLTVSDTYLLVPTDSNRDNPYFNQTYSNTFSISPYVEYRLNPRWTATGGYRYTNLYYGSNTAVNRQSNDIYFSFSREMNPKTFVSTSASYSMTDTSMNKTFSRLTHTVGLKYISSSASSITANGGYSVFLPQSGSSMISPYWNISIAYAWRSYTANMNSGVLYDSDMSMNTSEKLYASLNISKSFRRSSVGVVFMYSQVADSQTNSVGKEWISTGANASYELTRRAKASIGIAAGKYFREDDYRNSYSLGLNYELFTDLHVSGGYNRSSSSNAMFNPEGSADGNRIFITIKKDF